MFIYSRQAGDMSKKRGLTGPSVTEEINQQHQHDNQQDYRDHDENGHRGRNLLWLLPRTFCQKRRKQRFKLRDFWGVHLPPKILDFTFEGGYHSASLSLYGLAELHSTLWFLGWDLGFLFLLFFIMCWGRAG